MIERFEHLTQLIDFKLPTEHPDAEAIRNEKNMIQEKYQNQKIV